MSSMINHIQRTRIVIGGVVMLILAAMHEFRVGFFLSGKAYIYYYSFDSDLMLPVGAYFMLGMNETQLRFLRKWYIKAMIVFGTMTFSEILQCYRIYFFGVTFNGKDIIMYGVGRMNGVVVDQKILERLIPSRKYDD